MDTVDLPTFIRGLGLDAAATLFGENRYTVKSWLYRERMPRPETAQKIVRKARGKVTMEGIYGGRQQ